MIILTNQEFLEMTGINLYTNLVSHDQDPVSFADARLKEWSQTLYDKVMHTSTVRIPDDDKLNEAQIGVIKRGVKRLGMFKLFPVKDKTEDMILDEIMDDFRLYGLIKRSFGRRAWY